MAAALPLAENFTCLRSKASTFQPGVFMQGIECTKIEARFASFPGVSCLSHWGLGAASGQSPWIRTEAKCGKMQNMNVGFHSSQSLEYCRVSLSCCALQIQVRKQALL